MSVNRPKNSNYLHEKIKIRVKSEMFAIIRCRLSSSSLLSRNLKSEIYRTIILLFRKWERHLVSNTEGKRRVSVFENRVLRMLVGLTGTS
jgi:hypothetical protein